MPAQTQTRLFTGKVSDFIFGFDENDTPEEDHGAFLPVYEDDTFDNGQMLDVEGTRATIDVAAYWSLVGAVVTVEIRDEPWAWRFVEVPGGLENPKPTF